MGNDQSSEPWEEDETKVEPGGSKGRERGQSRSRSASPQKKRHQKGGSPPEKQQQQQGGVKAHPPEKGEEEDEWLQGSAALAIAGGKKKKGGKGKKGKGGGGGGGGKGASPPEGAAVAPAATPTAPATAATTKPIEDTEAAARRQAKQQQQQQQQPPSTGTMPATPPKALAPASPRRARASGKSVQWGEVVVQTFTRRASQDSVPACGAWPLGLGEEAGEAPVTASLEEYEAARSEEIERRIQELPKRLRKIATGETRQFDYKSSGDRNPIFGPLREQERKQVLLKALLHAHAEADGGVGGHGHSPGGGSGHGNQHRQAAALEEQEQLRCLELDDLRASRKRIGCSCHQSKAPEKLSLKKLKEELHRRHLSAPGTDKGKLAELLKQALSEERLCSEHAADKCECFEAGVPCHADVCGCCAHKKGLLHTTSDGGHKRHLGCHNPVGNFVYKEGAVHGYRGRFLSACSAVDGRPRSCSI